MGEGENCPDVYATGGDNYEISTVFDYPDDKYCYYCHRIIKVNEEKVRWGFTRVRHEFCRKQKS